MEHSRVRGLTIAIPTFQRRETVRTTVQQFRAVCADLPIRVLVADNASSDGTAAALSALTGDSDVALDVVAGAENLGILGNFLRLAEHCSTSHLLLLSDEEGPVRSDVYARLIGHTEHWPRDVLVPAPSRGVDAPVGLPVTPEELWDATNYLSGIVYPVEELRSSIEAVRAIGEQQDIAAIWHLWPFYLVIVDMMLRGYECRWIPDDLYVRRERLATTVEDERFPAASAAAVVTVASRDPLRARYKTLEARLAQYSATATFLAARAAMDGGVARNDILRRFEHDLHRKVYPTVQRRLAAEHPQLAAAFLSGAATMSGPWERLRTLVRRIRSYGLRRVLRQRA
jgi:glycosyltransferase involved in cell wall biosynthesis